MARVMVREMLSGGRRPPPWETRKSSGTLSGRIGGLGPVDGEARGVGAIESVLGVDATSLRG